MLFRSDLTETGNRARKVSGTQGRDLSLGLEQGWDRAPHSEKKKKLVWAKKNIGERSERRGCPLGSLHSPIFSPLRSLVSGYDRHKLLGYKDPKRRGRRN